MSNGLGDAIARVERRRKTLEVFTSSTQQVDQIARQFSTKNVVVEHSPLPADAESGFIIIRGADGDYRGSLGLGAFEALLSPDIHPPWELAARSTDYDELFDFLDDTLFSSYDRRQMLATAREIEERSWRTGDGRLYAGFQSVDALRAQERVYEALASHGQLSVQLFLNAEWDVAVGDQLPVLREAADEIGAYWFVIFDGGGRDLNTCGLLAEERSPGAYYGFWTYDPAIVGDLISYLETEYGPW